MDEGPRPTVENIISRILQHQNFRTLISDIVSQSNTNTTVINSEVTQPSHVFQAGASGESVSLTTVLNSRGHSSSPSVSHSSPSLLQNLRSLFPSSRGKMPVFSKSKKRGSWSATFYRDVILLKNPRTITTLKGSKKTEAFNAGLAVTDVKFDCTWDKQQIVKYLRELFPAHLSENDEFEILLPDCGRLIKIDESREQLDGSKLKRLFYNRKAVYLRSVLTSPHASSTTQLASSTIVSASTIEPTTSTVVADQDCDYNETDSLNTTLSVDSVENDCEYLMTENDEDRFELETRIAVAESLKQPQEVTIQSLLKQFSMRIKDECVSHFNIYRREVFASCIRATTRKRFDPFAKILVTFTDAANGVEGAIDVGGPKREMFRLLFQELKDGLLFEGSKKKYISLNCKCLERNQYFEAGKLIALAIVHLGQGPVFFSDLLFSVIVNGINATKPNEEFVDENTLNSINMVRNVNTLDKLQEVVMNDPVFALAGIYYVSSLEEKELVIQRVLNFYNFYRVKAAIDQFIDGLKTCGVYETMVKYPDMFYSLMCADPPPLTSDIMLKLFKVNYSDTGSNCRNVENRVVGFWRDYILDCSETEDDDDICATLEDILIFATGSSNVPLLGFDANPTIHFIHENQESQEGKLTSPVRYFPEANTCSLDLRIPASHKDYDSFKTDMNYAIKNCKVFGKI